MTYRFAMVAIVQTPTRPAPIHPTDVMVVESKAAMNCSGVDTVAFIGSAMQVLCLRSMSEMIRYDLKQAAGQGSIITLRLSAL